MFYFYMPDTVKHVGLSAVMAKSNKPVPLNGQDVYQYKLDDGSGGDGVGGDKKNPTTKSLVVKGTCNLKLCSKYPYSMRAFYKTEVVHFTLGVVHFVPQGGVF